MLVKLMVSLCLMNKKYDISGEYYASQVSDYPVDYHSPTGLQQPTLILLGSLLSSITSSLERAADEKSLILNKVLHR